MKRYLGVDLHKRSFTVCFLEEGKEEGKVKEYNTETRGIERFRKELKKEDSIAVEATTGTRYFVSKVKDKVRSVRVINTSQFKVISESTNKTDINDATTIARYLKLGLLPEVKMKEDKMVMVQKLIKIRDNYIKSRTALKNNMHSLLASEGIITNKKTFNSQKGLELANEIEIKNEVVKKIVEKLIKTIMQINESIKEFETEIDNMLKGQKEYENLQTITGIGSIVSAAIVSGIGDITNFKESRQLASYFGLVPTVRDSGGKQNHGKITKRGNKIVRTYLVQAAYSAVIYNKYLRRFYIKLKKKKCSAIAIVAVARKMIEIIFNALKNDWKFKDFNNWVLE